MGEPLLKRITPIYQGGNALNLHTDQGETLVLRFE